MRIATKCSGIDTFYNSIQNSYFVSIYILCSPHIWLCGALSDAAESYLPKTQKKMSIFHDFIDISDLKIIALGLLAPSDIPSQQANVIWLNCIHHRSTRIKINVRLLFYELLLRTDWKITKKTAPKVSSCSSVKKRISRVKPLILTISLNILQLPSNLLNLYNVSRNAYKQYQWKVWLEPSSRPGWKMKINTVVCWTNFVYTGSSIFRILELNEEKQGNGRCSIEFDAKKTAWQQINSLN